MIWSLGTVGRIGLAGRVAKGVPIRGRPIGNPPRSADLMVQMITGSDEYMKALKNEPTKTLTEVASLATKTLLPPAYLTDRVTYRIVVSSLGTVAVVAILGAIFLSTYAASQIPDVLTALGSAAIGALAGILAPSPT